MPLGILIGGFQISSREGFAKRVCKLNYKISSFYYTCPKIGGFENSPQKIDGFYRTHETHRAHAKEALEKSKQNTSAETKTLFFKHQSLVSDKEG